ncbi:MAG TPA: calcium-binding protein [Allosphingosinicella sp.]|uniref:calcium-binding protein n=1 Tax=Allosphingosinicella sp. TaxID=2823234 RepID=UPI002EDAD137
MAVIVGTAASETLNGTEGNDELAGLGGDDTLNGLGGNDEFRWFSNEGNDTINGGDGRDRASFTFINNTGVANQTFFLTGQGATGLLQYGNPDSSTVNPLMTVTSMNAVEDVQIRFSESITLSPTIRIDSSISNAVSGTIEVIQLSEGDTAIFASGITNSLRVITGDGRDSIYGGSGVDQISTFGGDDILNGGSGNDTLLGGTGNDTYFANAGDTVIEEAGAGTDAIVTAENWYRLYEANVENLFFNGTGNFVGIGNELNNYIEGGNGNDQLYGLDGNDTLYGRGGNNELVGGAGDDTYVVESNGDTLVEMGGEGNDTVLTSLNSYILKENFENLRYSGSAAFSGYGNNANNELGGGTGGDTLYGFSGNDRLSGNNGADILNGGAGDDALIGGAGPDELIGGTGADRFQYDQVGDFGDLILDFDREEGDKIDVSNLANSFGTDDPFASGNIRMEQVTINGQQATRIFVDPDSSTPEGEFVLATVYGDAPLQPSDFIV